MSKGRVILLSTSSCGLRNCNITAPPYGDWGVLDTLQSTVDELRPGNLWFSKPNLDTFGDLIISMTQYRPSDRPSASDVLQHP